MAHAIELTPDFAEQLQAVHSAAFPPHDAWGRDAFRDLLAQPTTRARGIVESGHLMAFIVVQFVAEDAEILTLATRPNERRRGLAGKVLSQLQQELQVQGLKKILLDVAEDNLGARAFYVRHGFQVDGRRPNYYKRLEGQRIDAILMSKAVGGQIHP